MTSVVSVVYFPNNIIIPNPINANPARYLMICNGIIRVIISPKNTPIKVVNNNALPQPRKIINGDFDSAAKVKVASCVLSPNSAINIIINELINNFQFI